MGATSSWSPRHLPRPLPRKSRKPEPIPSGQPSSTSSTCRPRTTFSARPPHHGGRCKQLGSRSTTAISDLRPNIFWPSLRLSQGRAKDLPRRQRVQLHSTSRRSKALSASGFGRTCDETRARSLKRPVVAGTGGSAKVVLLQATRGGTALEIA